MFSKTSQKWLHKLPLSLCSLLLPSKLETGAAPVPSVKGNWLALLAHGLCCGLQEQLGTMHCLLEMNKWNDRAGNALTRAIIMVSNSVKNSLQGTPNEFTPEELLHVCTQAWGLVAAYSTAFIVHRANCWPTS